jgi:dihydroxyacetone kinase-like predicted kinase
MNAQSLSQKNLVVIPTKSINEGIAAAIAFSSDASVEENTSAFLTATEAVTSAAVTYAVRNTKIDNIEIKEGDIIGLDERSIIAKGKTPNEVVIKVCDKLVKPASASITLFYGEGVKEADASVVAAKLGTKFEQCEITPINGGQSVYYYLVSIE